MDIGDDIFARLFPVTDLLSRGGFEYRMRTSYKLGKSSIITVDTVFYAANRRIDVQARVDCSERHWLLKAGFDVNIRSTFINDGIQFGYIDRPTTCNNCFEDAKFEICNHKWSDLSETRCGAVLLICKSGIDPL